MLKAPSISVLTIVKGRRQHLINLMVGLLQNTLWPSELIIIHMNENKWSLTSELPNEYDKIDEGLAKGKQMSNLLPLLGRGYVCTFQRRQIGFRLRQIELFSQRNNLPLAEARNLAVDLAMGENLIFLDVDCIPSAAYVEKMQHAIFKTDALVMSNVSYLPEGANEDGWDFTQLQEVGQYHPRRPSLSTEDLIKTQDYFLFWSLSFGCSKTTFHRIGGFDKGFTGYGGEDTDFALSARLAGVSFYLSGAVAYHQYHTTLTPPLQHLTSIVKNAKRYRKKWNEWPMEGWLKSFEKLGFISWDSETLSIQRLPSKEDLEKYRSHEVFA